MNEIYVTSHTLSFPKFFLVKIICMEVLCFFSPLKRTDFVTTTLIRIVPLFCGDGTYSRKEEALAFRVAIKNNKHFEEFSEAAQVKYL